MRAVVQRVSEASVSVEGRLVSEIGGGFLVLVAIEPDDTHREAEALVGKLSSLRVFPDENGRMNRSILDTGGAVLVVSQFTLAGSLRRGRRPSFTGAAAPEMAEPMVEEIARAFAAEGIAAHLGAFGARMEVALINDGPVTFAIDVRDGTVV